MSDDPVKVEHGNVAESIFRSYLKRVLPKKYGVEKGHVITRDVTYDGPLEEWDIIVYDALESPILYVRGDSGSEEKVGIPVEHVKCVVEVKATLNRSNTEKTTRKLLKLKPFLQSPNGNEGIRNKLPIDFFAYSIFMETSTSSSDDYSKCLDNLHPLWTELSEYFEYSLVLRSQNNVSASGLIGPLVVDSPNSVNYLVPCVELSSALRTNDELYSYMVSYGFGETIFPDALMTFIERLNNGPFNHEFGGPSDFRGFGRRGDVASLVPLWEKS